ncbi:MAG: PQQ-like beta-propeller repeat protein [Pirellulaceae bacterium]
MRIAVQSLIVCFVTLPAALSIAGEFEEAAAGNWHQWRGPLATGVSPTAEPPTEWSEEKNIKWKVRIPGDGSSTPAVWGDRVYVLSAEATDRAADEKPEVHPDAKTLPPDVYYRFLVLCLDRATGKVLWQKTACEAVPHEGRHQSHSYAGSSPLTEGRRLYAFFGSRGLFCYDLDGQLLWRRDFGKMRTRYGWGEAATPALHGDTLIVPWDQEDESFVVALDAATGETRWRKDRDEPTGWATPLIVEQDGATQVILNGANRVRSYDLTNGELLWECGGQTVNAIPSPVRHGDAVVCMSGYRGYHACAIPLAARGDVTGGETVRWSHGRGTPYVPSPLLYDGLLYFTRANSAILTCLDAESGEPAYEMERLSELNSLYASPSAADGKIYITDRDGVTMVLRHGREFKVLAVNRLDDPVDASPVPIGKSLLLRGRRHLYCIEESQ